MRVSVPCGARALGMVGGQGLFLHTHYSLTASSWTPVAETQAKERGVGAGKALPGKVASGGLPKGFLLCSPKPGCRSSGCRDH